MVNIYGSEIGPEEGSHHWRQYCSCGAYVLMPGHCLGPKADLALKAAGWVKHPRGHWCPDCAGKRKR